MIIEFTPIYAKSRLFLTISILIVISMASVSCQINTTSLSDRVYKYDSEKDLHCIYNKYNTSDVIYECVKRTVSPQ